MVLDQHEARVTLTFGVCELGDSQDLAAAIRGADQALYEGKRNGKNTVVQAPVCGTISIN
jgi:PleD family two-component response regulator